jgi:hypothetical protein
VTINTALLGAAYWGVGLMELALFGPHAMSDLSPISGVKRKSDFGANRSVDDPEPDIGQALAPTHALTKRLYSVMLLTQFLS